MNRERTSPLGFYTIGIAALFLIGFLLLIVFAAGTYRDAVMNQDANNQNRALRAYLVTCTRSAAEDDIAVRQENGTQVLTIRDSGTQYGLRIFLHDGELMESYGKLADTPDPASSQPIAATDTFEVEQLSGDVFAVTTQAGRTLLHVGQKTGMGGETQ